MNAFARYSAEQALFLAHQRSQELIAEAQAHRMASRARKNQSRVEAAVASIRTAFRPAGSSRETTVVPRLSDYPYRS
jgi:hypothetical protein